MANMLPPGVTGTIRWSTCSLPWLDTQSVLRRVRVRVRVRPSAQGCRYPRETHGRDMHKSGGMKQRNAVQRHAGKMRLRRGERTLHTSNHKPLRSGLQGL